jgi:hypothetical protein
VVQPFWEEKTPFPLLFGCGAAALGNRYPAPAAMEVTASFYVEYLSTYGHRVSFCTQMYADPSSSPTFHRLPLYDAALNLAATFHLPRTREGEPIK